MSYFFMYRMVSLSLTGLLTGFDNYGKLLFAKETNKRGEKDMKKLWDLNEKIEGRCPINDKGYVVLLGKIKPKVMHEFIGCHIKIKVKVNKYDFATKNGDRMQGFNLKLIEVICK